MESQFSNKLEVVVHLFTYQLHAVGLVDIKGSHKNGSKGAVFDRRYFLN